MLHGLEAGERPLLGRRVAVYGGGDTAIDAARTAKRLGASDAVVVYRRTRDRMPAHDDEVTQAEEEGVEFHWLSTIERVEPGRARSIEQMELGRGRLPAARPAAPSGWPPTRVVLALGQDTDLSLLGAGSGCRVTDGTVETDRCLRHRHARGLRRRRRRRRGAVGHRRHRPRPAGRREHRRLAGRPGGPAPAPRPTLAPYEALNTWYFEDAPRSHRPRLELARRSSTFDEVVHGLDADTALFEARRCLSCGSCFSCDNCYALCPDNAVIKLGPPGAVRDRPRLLQGLRDLRRGVSRPARSRWCPRRSRPAARGRTVVPRPRDLGP